MRIVFFKQLGHSFLLKIFTEVKSDSCDEIMNEKKEKNQKQQRSTTMMNRIKNNQSPFS